VVHAPRDPNAPFVCDVRELTRADESSLDALARLQVTARRYGTTIRLHNVSPALADLIDVAGLAGVLVVAGSGVEVDRQVEQGEVRRIDEEVDPGDEPV